MYKQAGLGVVVVFGIICILKMLALGYRVNRNVQQNNTPSASPNPNAKLAPDPNAKLSDPITTTDPVNNAPKHDPANDASKREPTSVAPKTDAEAGRGFDPNFLHNASLQVWFGRDKELAATCDKTLKFMKDTNNPALAERTAKICSLRPMDDQIHEAALVLARRAVDLGKGNRVLLPFLHMALGMAEYRSGNYAEAEAALIEAAKLGKDNYYVARTTAFYRAMNLFRQGKETEAQKLATEAFAKMKPLPADERDPLVGTSNADDLILWMAYKEAKELLKLMR